MSITITPFDLRLERAILKYSITSSRVLKIQNEKFCAASTSPLDDFAFAHPARSAELVSVVTFSALQDYCHGPIATSPNRSRRQWLFALISMRPSRNRWRTCRKSPHANLLGWNRTHPDKPVRKIRPRDQVFVPTFDNSQIDQRPMPSLACLI